MTDKLRTAITFLAIMMGSVSYAGPNQHFHSELNCLATNIYHESKGEDFKGKLAVAYTTLNRVRNDLFPKTICSVVWQDNQFSWTEIDGLTVDKQNVNWVHSKLAAIVAFYGLEEDPTYGALFFHANYIGRPSWTKNMRITLKHGGHTFYTLG